MIRAICTGAHDQRMKESLITIRGDGDQDPVASEEVDIESDIEILYDFDPTYKSIHHVHCSLQVSW